MWSFGVLSAAQLTIRLIMAFSIRLTLIAAIVLSLAAIGVTAAYELAFDTPASLASRIELAPLTMMVMGVIGFAEARWLLRIRRLRGQVVAGLMVGLLDPHLFTLV